MITGKNSFRKGGLLFIGAAALATCAFVTIATGILTLQVIAGVAIIAEAIGVYRLFKTIEKSS